MKTCKKYIYKNINVLQCVLHENIVHVILIIQTFNNNLEYCLSINIHLSIYHLATYLSREREGERENYTEHN